LNYLDRTRMSTTKDQTQDVEDPKKNFSFLGTLNSIHNMVMGLDGYRSFMLKYVPLQIGRLSAALIHVVAFYCIADGFDMASPSKNDRIVLGFVGAMNLVGRLTPYFTKLYIDNLKEVLQSTQACGVVGKLFALPHSNVISTPTGEVCQLIGKIFRNLDTLLPALYGAIIPLFIETFVAVIFIAATYGFLLAAMQLFLFALFTGITFRAAAAKAQRNKELMVIMLSEWGKILAVLQAYERAHFFGNVEEEVGKARVCFEKIGEKYTAVFRNEHVAAMYLQFISLFITGGFIFVLMFYIGEDIEGIELAALAFYFVIYMGSLEQYAGAISQLRAAVQEYETFQEFLDRSSNIADIDDPIELPLVKNPSIEFKNVFFSYEGKDILQNVSFKLEGGQTLGLVGPSGCGKSTIIRLLMRFYKVTDGVILIDGHDICSISADSLRRLFSVVTQHAQLFNGTVGDNIGYGKLGSSDEDILRAAKMAELSFEEGVQGITLDKEVGEGGQKLSGGQQQRVALARAMLKNGTIYLLDEPTTGLDGLVAEHLQQTLDSVSSNATTVCITHHLADLKHSDNIIYLDGGEIVESGTFGELVEQRGRFFEQLESRMSSAI